jgi:acyl-coenzyme A thioesterase PaaI-like protein
MREVVLHAIENECCIVCGQENNHGMKINYQLTPKGIISAQWIPSEKYEGLKGIIHGGILTAVIDEAMSKTIIAMSIEALTVELNVRFHNYVTSGDKLRISAGIVKKEKRKIITEGFIVREPDEKILHAGATFLIIHNNGG